LWARLRTATIRRPGSGEQMNNYGDSTPSPDHLQVALEASNGALIGLEWILAQLAEETADRASVCRHTKQAIDSLRQAIAELRLARGEAGGPLALGFVVKTDSKRGGGAGRRRAQPIPRRTA
jgi:hypothetical protein